MPQPHLRTRSKKRVKKTSPGSRNRVYCKKEMTSTPSCDICGKPLAGMAHLATAEIRKLNRSKRRIWRLHGGKICHNCLKNALKQAARTI